jgi:hypothetical protein
MAIPAAFATPERYPAHNQLPPRHVPDGAGPHPIAPKANAETASARLNPPRERPTACK